MKREDTDRLRIVAHEIIRTLWANSELEILELLSEQIETSIEDIYTTRNKVKAKRRLKGGGK